MQHVLYINSYSLWLVLKSHSQMQSTQNGQNDHKSLYSFLIYCSFRSRQCFKYFAVFKKLILTFSAKNCMPFTLATRNNPKLCTKLTKPEMFGISSNNLGIVLQPEVKIATSFLTTWLIAENSHLTDKTANAIHGCEISSETDRNRRK